MSGICSKIIWTRGGEIDWSWVMDTFKFIISYFYIKRLKIFIMKDDSIKHYLLQWKICHETKYTAVKRDVFEKNLVTWKMLSEWCNQGTKLIKFHFNYVKNVKETHQNVNSRIMVIFIFLFMFFCIILRTPFILRKKKVMYWRKKSFFTSNRSLTIVTVGDGSLVWLAIWAHVTWVVVFGYM